MLALIVRRSPITTILLVCAVLLLLLALALVLAMQAQHSGPLLATLTPNVMFPGH